MKIVLFYAAVAVLLIIGVAAGVAQISSVSKQSHSCVSPCEVTLPKDTLEDEWRVDYGWRDKHTPILGVYFTGHNKPGQHYDDVAISQDARGNVTLVQGLWHGKPVVTLFDAELVD